MPEYRIEDLARESGATVRNIRAYQDRGLLPRPGRRGRTNVYDGSHLARLRQISGLLERGYTLASIKELLEAWDSGRGLGGVLGLLSEVDGPWSDESPARLTRARIAEAFEGADTDEVLAGAVALGVLEPEGCDVYLVPSPRLLAVAAELYAAGVPLGAIAGHLRGLRRQMEDIAQRFLDFVTEHVFQRYLDQPPSAAHAAEAAQLVRRLRPLAQLSVDAELARAMRTLAARHLHSALGPALGPPSRAPDAPEALEAARPPLDHVPAGLFSIHVEAGSGTAAVPGGTPRATGAAPAPAPAPASTTTTTTTTGKWSRAGAGSGEGEGEAAGERDWTAPVRLEVTIPEETAVLLRALLARADHDCCPGHRAHPPASAGPMAFSGPTGTG